MSDRNFMQLLKAQWDKGHFVCVGLDSESKKIPNSVYQYCGFNFTMDIPITKIAPFFVSHFNF